MNTFSYQQQKKQFMEALLPHKTIDLCELQHVGDNIFDHQGIELAAEDDFTQKYDDILGINGHHRKLVKGASGETGLSNYRNYINVASNMDKPRSVVIVASPESKKLTNIIPIVEEYIAPALFFDFAEMMAEETGFEISDMKFSNTSLSRITLTFTNPHPNPFTFAPGEDFITDGFYLSWTPTEVELGHYYERLVCSNGQTVTDQRRDSYTHKLSSADMTRIINFVKNKEFASIGIERFGNLLSRASSSRISLAEMGHAQKLLIGLGVDNQMAEQLVPYNAVRQAYETAGYYSKEKERLIKGDDTIWNIYNVLTEFATHNQLWDDSDHRRVDLMNGAVKMLERKPDIQTYYDIYQ